MFRRLVDLNKKCYHGLRTKRDKSILVESIVLAMQRQGGRFLKQNPKTGLWDEEIPFKQALLKTGQALREQVKKSRPCPPPKITVVPPPPKQQLQEDDDDESSSTRDTTTTTSSSSSPSFRPPLPTPIMDFCHVESCSDDEAEGFAALVAPPPMLRVWSSALCPATSKIAGPAQDQRITMEQPLDDYCPPPVCSFDEVLMRQESLGVSGSFLPLPEMSFGTSVMFTALDLIDD